MPAPDLSFELELPKAASAGSYRFLGMTGNEALGRLFEFHIRFSSDKPTIDPLKMLGEKLRLSMQTEGGQRHFHAYATAFEFRGPIDLPLPAGAKAVAQFQYAVIARPWVWFLTRTSDCRVFQKLKVPEICDQIFGKYAGMVRKKLDADYQPWEYCVQYRETDFNFVSRLMEQEGVFYFFEHEKSDHPLKLVDLHGPTTATKHKIAYVAGERAGRMDKECIYGWTMQHEVQPGAYAIKDYDFKKPSSPLLSIVKRPYQHTQGGLEIFDYPGEFETMGEGDGYVRVRLEELRTQYETVRAVCNVRTIAAGDVFELSNPEQAGAAAKIKYLVTEAAFDMSTGLEFEARGPHYVCNFSCIRAEEQFRPKRVTPKPIVQGPQTATVVGPGGEEIHVDEYGRIKVRFHWDRHSKDDKESSCWVRVSHPWAGKNFGMVAIPRMGQEVVVDFLEGDPDRPLVTGRVYNQDNMPPYALPANKTQTGTVTRSSLGGSA
jgi:type VI secretion system secreted protein VgrG